MKNLSSLYQTATLLLFVCIGFCETVSADNPIKISQPQISPVSPEAAAVQKYICYPVNHSTGLADITIPLYTIKAGDLELPITLTYHSAGIKLHQLSGWVGTNWTLNAEPSVMREIKGIPDDAKRGGYRTLEYLKNKNNSNSDELTRFFRRIEDKDCDSEPDHFYYKLPNRSGTFYLGVKYTGYNNAPYNAGFGIYPYTPLKISGWELIGENGVDIEDENGVWYEFGGEMDGYTEKTGNYNTRWLCKSINSRQTRACISFNYSDLQRKRINPSYSSNYVVLEDKMEYNVGSGRSSVSDPTWFPIKENTFLRRPDSVNVPMPRSNYYGGYRLLIKQRGRVYYGNITDGKVEILNSSYPSEREYAIFNPYDSDFVDERKLTRIDFDGGIVLFEQDPEDNLSTITVKSRDGSIIRKFQFYISRYNAYTELTKLDSIAVTAGRDPERRLYSFLYDKPDNVQPVSSLAMDHWGYYNGQHELNNGTRLFIPYGRYYVNDDYYFHYGDSARECNEYHMKTGVLTDIFSPEGVRTNFSYEANRYGKVFSGAANYQKKVYLAGGLRVSMIRESDMHGGLSRVRYFQYGLSAPEGKYGNDGTGLGVAKVAVTQRDYCTEQERLTIGHLGERNLCRTHTWGATPVSNISFGNGNSVIYPYVRERVIADGAEIRTDYHFSAPEWDLYGGIPQDPFSPRQVRQDISKPFDPDKGEDALRYGHLIKKEIYSGDTLVEKHEYEYSIYQKPFKEDNDYTFAVVFGRPYKTRVCNVQEYDSRPQELYKDYTWMKERGASRLKRERTTRFSDTGDTSILTREHVYHPDSSNVYDGFDAELNGGGTLYATNHLNPLWTRTRTGNSEIMEQFIYPEEAKKNITINLGQDFLLSCNAINKLLVYKRVCGKDTTSLRNVYAGLNIYAVQAWNPTLSQYEDRLKYTYNDFGNISSVTSDGKIYTSYLWSYYNQYPVFKVENANIAKVLSALNKDQAWLTQLEAQGQPDVFALSGTSLPHTTLYTYRPLIGVSSIRGADGVNTYFEYDYWGRLIRSYILEDGVEKTISTFTYNTPGYHL